MTFCQQSPLPTDIYSIPTLLIFWQQSPLPTDVHSIPTLMTFWYKLLHLFKTVYEQNVVKHCLNLSLGMLRAVYNNKMVVVAINNNNNYNIIIIIIIIIIITIIIIMRKEKLSSVFCHCSILRTLSLVINIIIIITIIILLFLVVSPCLWWKTQWKTACCLSELPLRLAERYSLSFLFSRWQWWYVSQVLWWILLLGCSIRQLLLLQSVWKGGSARCSGIFEFWRRLTCLLRVLRSWLLLTDVIAHRCQAFSHPMQDIYLASMV